VGTVRAYVTLNPAAPQCGTDADSANNELRLTNEQVRAWLRGSAPSVIIPRSSLTY
jgi:flagellar motor component MotA